MVSPFQFSFPVLWFHSMGVISCIEIVGSLFYFYGFSIYTSCPEFDVGYDIGIIEVEIVLKCCATDFARSSSRTAF